MSAGDVYYAEDGTMSMVLDAKMDPGYEPSKQELDEYAQWLGIDVDKEPELMFLAREGLKAPLPDDWKPCKTDSGDVYYFNFTSGESIWEHPLDEHFKKRLEEEREKVRQGKPVGPSAETGKKKKKDEKPKLEKGGGAAPVAAAPAASAGQKAAPLAKTGRLGALGTPTMDKNARPDISELVPSAVSSNIPRTFQLPSSTPQQKDTSADDDRKLREALRAEHDEHLRLLKKQHEQAVAQRREELQRDLARQERELGSTNDEEVDDARRAAERRTRREYQMFEESIERQMEDLRRTLRQEQLRLDAENAAVDARVEQELSAKRKVASATVDAKVAARHSELMAQWHTEKAAAEAASAKLVEDWRRANQSSLTAMERKETDAVDRRLAELDAQHQQLQRSQRERLTSEHKAAVARLQSSAAAGAGSSNPEYVAAEARYADAIAAARADATSRNSLLRQEFAARRQAATERHVSTMSQRRMEATSTEESTRRLVEERLRAEAASALADAQLQLDNERRAKEAAFAEETQELVDAARRAAAASLDAAERNDTAEMQRVADERKRAHQQQLAVLRAAHDDHMTQLRNESAATGSAAPAASDVTSLVAAKMQQWLVDNPAPRPLVLPPTGDTGGADAAAAQERQALEDDAALKLASLVRKLEQDRAEAVDSHRQRAVADMDRRLSVFAAERRMRASSSRSAPEPRPTIVLLSPEAQQTLAEERSRLQSRLDGMALELAGGSGQPPRPESAASRELPNLRSTASASIRGSLPGSPIDPSRRGTPDAAAAAGGHDDEERRRLKRLEKAKARIRAEKASLRQRQDELEGARNEWRRDMRRAKESGDLNQQRVLHVAKGVLEERARMLNADTQSLKASIDLVKDAERKMGLRDASDGARVYDMLKEIAAKVDHVEKELHHHRRRSSPRRGGGGGGGGDPTAEKWQRYINPAPASRHVDVQNWLYETSP
jgi:centrosomal protein CEP164